MAGLNLTIFTMSSATLWSLNMAMQGCNVRFKLDSPQIATNSESSEFPSPSFVNQYGNNASIIKYWYAIVWLWKQLCVNSLLPKCLRRVSASAFINPIFPRVHFLNLFSQTVLYIPKQNSRARLVSNAPAPRLTTVSAHLYRIAWFILCNVNEFEMTELISRSGTAQ